MEKTLGEKMLASWDSKCPLCIGCQVGIKTVHLTSLDLLHV